MHLKNICVASFYRLQPLSKLMPSLLLFPGPLLAKNEGCGALDRLVRVARPNPIKSEFGRNVIRFALMNGCYQAIDVEGLMKSL